MTKRYDPFAPRPVPIAVFPMNTRARPALTAYREPVKRITKCATCKGGIPKGSERVALHAQLPWAITFSNGARKTKEITFHHPACLGESITMGSGWSCHACHVPLEEDDFRAAVFTKRNTIPSTICVNCYLSQAYSHCDVCSLLQPRHVMSTILDNEVSKWACQDCADGLYVKTAKDIRRGQRLDELLELRVARAVIEIQKSGILQ